ncbi:MAG: insulinase family protein [Paucibacter sp.]|nr:insulinase family protein [Roseateles sp.]
MKHLTLALILVLAGPALAAPAPVPAPTFVRELGGISEYRLPNGLQILFFPDEAQTTTTVNVTYRVGSRYESQGEYGMAHLLEHMLFKGTPKHKDIPTEFAKLAMRFNGTTTADRTNYFASFNADDKTLAYALDLEADRMVNSFIAKADLDKEMSVVRNEYERGESEPGAVLQKRVMSAAYEWHAYGHATIGPKSDIEGVPIERLQAFYRRFYRPDNATVLVAGRFEPKATLARIAAAFGPLKKPAEPVAQPYTQEPAQDGERTVVVRRVGGQPMLMAAYHVPAIGHPDSAALLVYGLLMSMQPSGHLYKELVETKLAVYAGLGGLGQADPGIANAFAVLPKEADAAAVETRLLDLAEGRADKPFTEDELKRVRDLAVLSYRNQMKSPEGLIGQISGLLGAGDWRLLFQLMDDLPKVTLTDVERVRKAYFRSANRTLGRYVPAEQVERVEIPPAPLLAERLAQLKPPPKVEEGERFDPTPEALAARSVFKTLKSGIELETLQKQTRGNTVTLQLQLRWGEPRATTAALGTTQIDELLFEGTPDIDKQKVHDEFVRLKAGVSIDGGNQGATLSITAEKDTLIESLRLAAELMQHPLLPVDAFDRIKKAQLAGLEGSRQELGVLRTDAVRGYYNRARGVAIGDPDYMMSLDERIAEARSTRIEDVRAFYEQYWSADAARVAVVGAIPEGLEAAIEQAFGAWKKPGAPRFERWVPKPLTLEPARVDVQAKDKANAEMHMGLRFALNREDADYLPLLLAARVFGEGGMETRLSTRVRRTDGLTYGIGADLGVPYYGRDAGLSIRASFAPENRDKVIAIVKEELERMGREGITAAELERARHEVLEARKRSRSRDGALAGTLNFMAETGKHWDEEARLDARIAAVTLEQANAAWRQYVRPDAFLTSTAGDFEGKTQAH